MRKTVWLALGLAGALASAMTSPAAEACTAECAEAVGCVGSCNIEMPGCGSACVGTCSLSCKLIGGPNCKDFVTADCERRPPPASPEEPQPSGEWAVVQYRSDGWTPLEARDLMAVAYSSPDFGERAVAKVLAEENRQIERHRREAPESKPLGVESLEALEAPRTVLVAGPMGGRMPVRIKVSFAAQDFPSASIGSSLYFRGFTDEDGRVIAVDAFYMRYSEQRRYFEEFIKTNLNVRNVTNPGHPVEFYGFVGVGPLGKAGYGIATAVELPPLDHDSREPSPPTLPR